MQELTQSRNPEAGDNAEAKESFSLAFSGLAQLPFLENPEPPVQGGPSHDGLCASTSITS